jgi:hypothetical protein
MTAEDGVFTIGTIAGDLTIKMHTLPVTGAIDVRRDGSIAFTVDQIPLSAETSWLLDEVLERGRLASWVMLRATASLGHIESDHVTIHGRGTASNSDGTFVTLQASISKLTVHHRDAPDSAAGCVAVYHTVGMRGFGAQEATTAAGVLRLVGVAKNEKHDEIAGFVRIKSHDQDLRPLAEWLAACDDTVEHVLQIVSLAEMHRVLWSIRQTFHGEKIVMTDLYGSRAGTGPYDGMFHSLNLQPVLDLAVNNYTPAIRENTGIELAINLLLLNPGYPHLLVINGMTALEHLNSVFKHHHPAVPPIEKITFKKKIKPALEKAFDETATTLTRPADDKAAADFEARLRRVRDRIGNLNHTTFTDDLFRMLYAYGVPIAGLEERIKAFIKARQDIIHTGEHDVEFKDFYVHVAVIRELLKRIILALVSYTGEYESFLNGQETVRFPPGDTVVRD